MGRSIEPCGTTTLSINPIIDHWQRRVGDIFQKNSIEESDLSTRLVYDLYGLQEIAAVRKAAS